VHCTKGTYVRTPVDDLGQLLGCGAHVGALRRGAVSPYEHSKMYTWMELEDLYEAGGLSALYQCLLPLETSVQAFPAIHLSSAAAFYLRTGQSVMAAHMPTKGLIRLFADDGKFLGIGEMLDDGRVTPRRLLNLTSTPRLSA
jgi:tRNA pseudouridine55 synthase